CRPFLFAFVTPFFRMRAMRWSIDAAYLEHFFGLAYACLEGLNSVGVALCDHGKHRCAQMREARGIGRGCSVIDNRSGNDVGRSERSFERLVAARAPTDDGKRTARIS